MYNYYVLKIRGYHEVHTNLPGSFQEGRDEVISAKPMECYHAHMLSRRLNSPANTTKRQSMS